MNRIEIIKGDITQMEVDAIVNTATSQLLGGGGGIDGTIHEVAGPGLMAECQQLRGCVIGAAKMTAGYDLPARHVIHTVSPQWDDGNRNEEALLASCYRECMKLAQRHELKSIAFPILNCGLYGFPIETACEIALGVVAECLEYNPQLERVVFVCYRDAVQRTLTAYLQQLMVPLGQVV